MDIIGCVINSKGLFYAPNGRIANAEKNVQQCMQKVFTEHGCCFCNPKLLASLFMVLPIRPAFESMGAELMDSLDPMPDFYELQIMHKKHCCNTNTAEHAGD